MTSRPFSHQLCQGGRSRLWCLPAHMTWREFQQLLCCLSVFQAWFLYILVVLLNHDFFFLCPRVDKSHITIPPMVVLAVGIPLLQCLCLFCSSLCGLLIICYAETVQSILGCSSEGTTLKIRIDLVYLWRRRIQGLPMLLSWTRTGSYLVSSLHMALGKIITLY